jgi:hypothetical protein
MIGDIKTGSFKKQTGPAGNQAMRFPFAMGTNLDGRIGYSLKFFEFIPALGAFILIGRHKIFLAPEAAFPLLALFQQFLTILPLVSSGHKCEKELIE